MGVGGFRGAKYSFWGQNNDVLAIRIFFLKFYTVRVQDGVILNQL